MKLRLIGYGLILLFVSCHGTEQLDDEEIPVPKSSKYWGYFDGYIKDKQFNVANYYSTIRSPIYSTRQIIQKGIESIDSINYIASNLAISDNITLSIDIYNFTPKKRYVSSFPFIEEGEGYIKAEVDNNIYTSVYTLDNRKRLELEIKSIIWESPLDPIIEVNIQGFLFNIENNNDSIKIDATYGSR